MAQSASNTKPMTGSGLALAKTALAIAQQAIPAYSHKNSQKTYTQHQLVALLTVRQFFDLDYRGTEQLALDWSDLRNALGLKQVPDHSTLQKAEQRLLKKTISTTC